jgi:NADH-quinone oxidoreductase subunit A
MRVLDSLAGPAREARRRGREASEDESRREGTALVLDDYFPLLIYGLLALAIPLTLVTAAFFASTRPSRRVKARSTPFESGVSTGPPARQRFTISFYLMAMLFIVFDIEIVFLYPVAVVLDAVGWFAVAEFGFFLGILVLAYVYIWRKGALEWR